MPIASLFRRPTGLFCLLGLALMPQAMAITTVAITGGDSGEGLMFDPSLVLQAYSFNASFSASSPFTVQGVVFNNLKGGVQQSKYINSTGGPFAGTQVSANDVALTDILQTVAWDGGDAGMGKHLVQTTFTGLTAGASYQLDLIYWSGIFADRTESVLVNNVTVGLITPNQAAAYDSSVTATADANGVILLQYAQAPDVNGAQDGVLMNAVVLSTAAVPEPSTYGLLGAGMLAAASFVHRRRKVS